jgi:hypothetical protein
LQNTLFELIFLKIFKIITDKQSKDHKKKQSAAICAGGSQYACVESPAILCIIDRVEKRKTSWKSEEARNGELI